MTDSGFLYSAIVLSTLQGLVLLFQLSQFILFRPTLKTLGRLNNETLTSPHSPSGQQARTGEMLVEQIEHIPIVKHYLHLFGVM
jgi:hypothetical protein